MENIQMIAYEAFIRRASQFQNLFMLKGSYVGRQYFDNPEGRKPADIDWVYMGDLRGKSVDHARKIFDKWVTLITEMDLNDGVKFKSFKENAFWRSIDYAMADDFPTVNTDLECWVDGELFSDFELDISFNLDIEHPPVPLQYKAVRGDDFYIPNTVPLSLQVAWKVHQTLVRPRFKDLFDLMQFVQHPTFDRDTLELALQALVNECAASKVPMSKLKLFLKYKISRLFGGKSIVKTWGYWRHDLEVNDYRTISYFDKASYITDATLLPENLDAFLDQFATTMQAAGWDMQLMDQLPKPKKS